MHALVVPYELGYRNDMTMDGYDEMVRRLCIIDHRVIWSILPYGKLN